MRRVNPASAVGRLELPFPSDIIPFDPEKENRVNGRDVKPRLPRNVWIVSVTSFLTDVSSEMIVNALPLFMKNVLGMKTYLIGLVEGIAEFVASLLKLFSGWLSDRLGMRKSLAVWGYAISALSKPLFWFASSWGWVAAARWGDRIGKGVRTAPRDALIADSTPASRLGLAYGLHRAADTAGAFVGLLVTLLLVRAIEGSGAVLRASTFRTLVLVSLLPAFLAVAVLAWGAREVSRPVGARLAAPPRFALGSLGPSFGKLMMIIGIFELGNSSDAFLILRAQERGLSLVGIFAMLIAFNFVYTALSAPAGRLSDRISRKTLIACGWGFYAFIYLGFALAGSVTHVVVLYVLYGVYYALTYGTSKALVADIVPATQRGAAFGAYNALLGLSDLPASLIAGFLWEGGGGWHGFGVRAPFFFGAVMALLALVLLLRWKPRPGA
jgi:MFS family permease